MSLKVPPSIADAYDMNRTIVTVTEVLFPESHEPQMQAPNIYVNYCICIWYY
jgi:hypothetical protein